MTLKMTTDTQQDNEEPPSIPALPSQMGNVDTPAEEKKQRGGLFSILRLFTKPKPDNSLRDTIAEYIEEDDEDTDQEFASSHEKNLIANILNLKDMRASDIMVPRVDIIGINETTTRKELFALLAEKQYSRLPVYKATLDHVIGSIHAKDILAALARGEEFDIPALVRDVPIISPSMHLLDLLWEMRETKKHMALIADEFGGVDGLVTIGDVIEAIVGEIEDEHDTETHPEIATQTDGTILADARVDLEEFEEKVGIVLTREEREENETLGGLIFFIAGRVPAHGEILKHKSGIMFEITEADPRRVKRIRIRNLPQQAAE